MIAEKAEEAVTTRVVYKISELPAGLIWSDIKDALKEAIAPEGPIFIVHTDGATEAMCSAVTETLQNSPRRPRNPTKSKRKSTK